MTNKTHSPSQQPSGDDLPDVLKFIEKGVPQEQPSLPGTTGKRYVLPSAADNMQRVLAATTSMSQEQEKDKVQLLMTKFKFDDTAKGASARHEHDELVIETKGITDKRPPESIATDNPQRLILREMFSSIELTGDVSYEEHILDNPKLKSVLSESEIEKAYLGLVRILKKNGWITEAKK
jgi:hypothetical protein